MIRSEVRAQVAANQPDAAPAPDGAGDPAPKAAAALPPQDERAPAAPSRSRLPWLVRNSRKATIALAVAAVAASPFAYRYLQREFGPDPFAGVKLDGVRIDPISGIAEVVKPPAAKPSPIRPAPAAAAVAPAPKPPAPRPSASPAAPAAAAPPATRFGVTHTRSAVAAPVTPTVAPPVAPPVAASREVSQANARPRANVGEERTPSRACTEAIAALGLCNPDPTEKGK